MIEMSPVFYEGNMLSGTDQIGQMKGTFNNYFLQKLVDFYPSQQ